MHTSSDYYHLKKYFFRKNNEYGKIEDLVTNDIKFWRNINGLR